MELDLDRFARGAIAVALQARDRVDEGGLRPRLCDAPRLLEAR